MIHKIPPHSRNSGRGPLAATTHPIRAVNPPLPAIDHDPSSAPAPGSTDRSMRVAQLPPPARRSVRATYEGRDRPNWATGPGVSTCRGARGAGRQRARRLRR